ncbi:hypothetical protein [Halosegnis longus]|uniref:hypothetical protein n=1 Tax=Halosegnis longus TaxID=2216012 RepID=UPI0011CEC79A
MRDTVRYRLLFLAERDDRVRTRRQPRAGFERYLQEQAEYYAAVAEILTTIAMAYVQDHRRR